MAVADESNARPSSTKERILGGFAIFGTPEYMAPEQVAGDPIDGRTDVYALGCVLYEMLTGVAAFGGPSSVVVMGMQLRETPPPPRARAPSQAIPAAVEAIVLRAMAKRPDERFPSAEAMREALEQTLSMPARRHARAQRVAAAATLTLSIVGAAAGSAYWARSQTVEAESAVAPAPQAMAIAGATVGASAAAAALAPVPVLVPTPAPPPAGPSLREARASAKLRASDPQALEAWARAALHAGELREARRAATAWTLHDGTVEPRLLMAQILTASGHHADAVATLNEWLESHPDSTDARSELARLFGARPESPESPESLESLQTRGGARELAKR
jgi:serine/threonine-protein kinase